MNKKQHLGTLLPGVLTLVLPAIVIAQSSQQDRTTAGTKVTETRAQPGIPASSSRDDTARGLSVTVSAERSLSDYVSYRSGKHLVIIIPQANATAMRWTLSGRGLVDVHIEQRGDDAALLFNIPPDLEPRIQQQLNRLEIFFGPSEPGSISPTNEPEISDGSLKQVNRSSRETNTSPKEPDLSRKQPGDIPGLLFKKKIAHAVQPLLSDSPVSQGGLSSLLEAFKTNTTADALNLDLSVPESPAFTVLGVTPLTVVRPGSPREFSSTLLNGLDNDGNFQNGLAIDTAPYMLFNGENVTIRDYNDQYLTRLLARTQFSFATTKGASKDDLSTRLAMGLNLTLWDKGDPRVYRPHRPGDVLQCFVDNLSTTIIIPPTLSDDQVEKFVASEQKRLKPLADQCRAEGRKVNWNRSSWTIAYAPSWISKTGQSSGFKWNGGAFWTSVAYGFEGMPSLEKVAQLIFHARYRTREQVPDPKNKGQFLTQNATFIGARFRAGSPKFALNLEDAFVRNSPLNGKLDSSNRFSLGVETRLTDNLYFVVSTGANIGRRDSRNKGFVLTSFKYGFNKKSQFNPQP